MAVKFTSVECPSCGAHLSVEEGREKIFCEYCGTQIIVANENEHTYRQVDEAAIKRAETEQMIRLKELELQEKEEERSRKGRTVAYTFALIFVILGGVLLLFADRFVQGGEYWIVGMLFLLGGGLIAEFASISKEDKKKEAPHIMTPYETQITENMTRNREKNYNTVAALFQSGGFSNVQTVAMGDLNFFTAKKNGQVESVSINGKTGFEEGDIFQKDARVVITYHSTK